MGAPAAGAAAASSPEAPHSVLGAQRAVALGLAPSAAVGAPEAARWRPCRAGARTKQRIISLWSYVCTWVPRNGAGVLCSPWDSAASPAARQAHGPQPDAPSIPSALPPRHSFEAPGPDRGSAAPPAAAQPGRPTSVGADLRRMLKLDAAGTAEWHGGRRLAQRHALPPAADETSAPRLAACWRGRRAHLLAADPPLAAGLASSR